MLFWCQLFPFIHFYHHLSCNLVAQAVLCKKAGYTPGKSIVYRRANIERKAKIHTHTYGQFNVTNSPACLKIQEMYSLKVPPAVKRDFLLCVLNFPLSTLHICAKKWENLLIYHWSHPLLHYTPFIAALWPFVGRAELERGNSANSSHAADPAIMLCLSCPNDKAIAPFGGTRSSPGVISVLMWNLTQRHLMIFQTITPNKRGLFLPTTFIFLSPDVIFFFQCPNYFTFASFLFSFSLNITSSLLMLPS